MNMHVKLQLRHKVFTLLLHGISFVNPAVMIFANAKLYDMETRRQWKVCADMFGSHRLGFTNHDVGSLFRRCVFLVGDYANMLSITNYVVSRKREQM
jgi:hypothetical protein